MIRLPPILYQFDYVDLFLNWYLMTWKQSKTNKNWQTKQRQIVLNQIFTTDLFLTVNWRYKINVLKGVENTTVVSYEKLRITIVIIFKTRIFKCVCSLVWPLDGGKWTIEQRTKRWRPSVYTPSPHLRHYAILVFKESCTKKNYNEPRIQSKNNNNKNGTLIKSTSERISYDKSPVERGVFTIFLQYYNSELNPGVWKWSVIVSITQCHYSCMWHKITIMAKSLNYLLGLELHFLSLHHNTYTAISKDENKKKISQNIKACYILFIITYAIVATPSQHIRNNT